MIIDYITHLELKRHPQDRWLQIVAPDFVRQDHLHMEVS